MQYQEGLVLKRVKSFYYVEVDHKVHLCRVKGNLFQKSTYDHKIAVGDRVQVDLEAAEDAGWIHHILDRQSALSRPLKEDSSVEQVLVANADNLLIVSSMKNPPLRFGMIDRFLITAQQGNLKPVIVLNKTDLVSEKKVAEASELYGALGYEVLRTSVPKQEGLEELYAILTQSITALAGHSGVGKSSLLNALFPEWNIRIGQVSKGSGKGKHTTTLSEMFPLPDQTGYVIDTPGVRALGLYGVTPETLDEYFTEFSEYLGHCHFKGCSHLHEPGCAVKDALEQGVITQTRYHTYCDIFDSLPKTNY